jgi:hypothetical protein
MILVSQSYTTKSERRNEELLACRKHNEESYLFDKVEYLDGESRTLSFNELHDHCVSKHRGRWCVIANSDIVFNSTAYMLKGLERAGRLVALTRWNDYHGPFIVGKDREGRHYSGSQDCWAFLAGTLPKMAQELPLGVMCCDQIIAGWAVSCGLELIDPAFTIKTTHVHTVDDRPADRPFLRGFYGYPHLTTMATSGEVLCHEWPNREGKWEQEWTLYRYVK